MEETAVAQQQVWRGGVLLADQGDQSVGGLGGRTDELQGLGQLEVGVWLGPVKLQEHLLTVVIN